MKTLIVLSPSDEMGRLLAQAAASRGHSVTALADVGSACAALGSKEYALVVAGTAADCPDAVEVCRRLRASSKGRRLWLLGVTSDFDGGEADRLLVAGADDCLHRACEPREAHLRFGVAERRLGMIEDIDARRRAEQAKREVEQALRRSESRLRNLVENMPDFMVLVGRDGVIRYVNHAAPAGDHLDLVGTVCFQYLAPQHLEQGRYILERAFQTGEVQTTVAADVNGSWWEARIIPLPAEGGEPTAMLICTDITRRREAEKALRESEGKLRGLFENLPDFVIVVDRTSTIQFVNRPVGPLSTGELEGSRGLGWIARGFEAKARQAFESACRTLQVQRVEVADVFNLWWDCRVIPLVEDGEVHNVMIICTDITESKHSEEVLRKEQRLLRRLLDLHERDRRVMAYEIHDSFAQMLAGAQLNFQAFERDFQPASGGAAESFNEGMRLLGGSIKEARRLISGLRPPVLDELGVVAAVEYLVCEHRTPGGPVIEYSAEVDFERLAPPLESAIFRIVQESLANACRHSGTDRIRVEMAERDDDVWIEVRDWGVGFETNRVDKRRFGLQGIRERARLLGGRATVESAPGVGTRVTVRLPLVHESPECS